MTAGEQARWEVEEWAREDMAHSTTLPDLSSLIARLTPVFERAQGADIALPLAIKALNEVDSITDGTDRVLLEDGSTVISRHDAIVAVRKALR